jgi:LysM repeat protein
MELLKKSIHTERIKTKSMLQIPLETDINVSDSKPDISKVIYSCGKIKVDEIKTGMNKIWVKGNLCYQILYQSPDADSQISGMEGEIPFMEEIYLDKADTSDAITGQDRVICKTKLDDMKIHIINSRKLSIQSVITLEPRVEEMVSQELCVELENTSGDSLEYRKKNMDYLETAVQKRDLLRIHEETKLPVGMPDIDTPLWKNAKVNSLSFRPMEEKLAITGELSLFVVYKEDATGKINWYETMLPFSGSVECVNSRDGMIPDVSYDVGHEEITIREDSDGESRVIGVEMTIELEIKLYERQSTQIVADVYGVTCDVNANIETNNFKDLYTELNMEEKLSKTLKVEESEPKILQVCHSDARIKAEEVTFEDNMLNLKGEIELQILYVSSGDDSTGIYAINDTVLFNITKEMPQTEGLGIGEYSLTLNLPQQTVSIKDSSQLEWRGSLGIKMLIYNTKSEDILTELNIQPINAQVVEKLPGFAIYYVTPKDTLWQIGKKYYVSVQRIKDMNNLTGDEIKAGDKLLIVK